MKERDALKVFGRRWLPPLLIGWTLLQVADIVLTYWGLTMPSQIKEANPVMAGVMTMPVRVVLMKLGLTIGVIGLLLKIEYRSSYSAIPVLAFLNLLMFYVFFNNWSLIAAAGSHIFMTRLGSG
jgi:hypothetical protein